MMYLSYPNKIPEETFRLFDKLDVRIHQIDLLKNLLLFYPLDLD
jgi:hypothetical protein